MFTRTKPKYQSLLESELERAIRSLMGETNGTDDYAKKMKDVERLYEMLKNEKTSSVSRDTLAIIGANILGIFMIIKHEAANVITSKAMNFVIRPR